MKNRSSQRSTTGAGLFLWHPMLADPGDELVVECAMNGRSFGGHRDNTQSFFHAGVLRV